MDSPTTPTGHVFISYAREDQPYTRKLADSLRQRGFEVWMDNRIEFGDRWWRKIVKAVRASAAFVIVMTPDSEESEWVEREILLAQDERKPIFPLLLRGKVNPLLITIQYANVMHSQMPPENFYERLAQAAPSKPKVAQRPSARQPVAETSVAPSATLEHEPVEPELILIPAGEFLMGSDLDKDKNAEKNEQPQHSLHLPEYYIAKTPVTNAQYLAFVEATGHGRPEHWKKGKPPKNKEDHPVVNVTWHDATAFCRWLAETTGRPYRLPSEAEWEKAARGTEGRIYPWGDDPPDETRCNFGDNVGDTTPVGQYSPRGDSPYGCVDMCGNVWERTLSLWGKELMKPDFNYPYEPKDGREDPQASGFRVCRGGAFGGFQRVVRCACRAGGTPYGWLSYVGFRVVLAPGL